MRAAGYVRVSTQEQKKHGWNLDTDRERIRQRIDCEKDWEFVHIWDDGGREGDDPDRPALLQMLASLDSLDVVVMRDTSRISRELLIYATVRNAFRKHDVKVCPGFDASPVELGLLENFKAVMDEEAKLVIGRNVKQAMRARVGAGIPSGGTPRYGFAWDDDSRVAGKGRRALVVVPAEAAVVTRVHSDYASGLSQRAIQRALNAECVPAPGGGVWQQSAIARILSDPIYIGKLTNHAGAVVDGQHEAIVDAELWSRVQAIRDGGSRRKSGRPADGGHLLVRGLLRCTCGSAMIPRPHGPRSRRDRYICRGRVEHGADFCSQPSIVREAIDEPLLAALLDGYIDLDATRKRIEGRIASALARARESLDQAEREAAKAEAKLVKVRGDYQAGDIAPDDWSEQRLDLVAAREAAQEAVSRAQEHVARLELEGLPDAEQTLLDHLATLKQAVAAGVDSAPTWPRCGM